MGWAVVDRAAASFELLPAPTLVDSTLREGAQAPGVNFSIEQQLRVIRGLCRVGIEEVEIGYAPDAELPTFLARARRHFPDMRVTLWCRARVDDLQACVQLGPDAVSVALPISDLHLERRLGRSRSWALARVSVLRDLAGSLPLCLGFEDATRATPEFVAQMCRCAASHGIDRIRLADTVGVASPSEVTELVHLARQCFGSQVGIHAHDDFGMATANAVSAIRAGARRVDVSVLGLGERAGISKLEEVVAYLALRLGDSRFRPTELPALARLVAGVSSRVVEARRPVVGEGLFECESGIHVDGLLKDPSTYEPYEPALVGVARRRIRLGAKSGRAAVTFALRELGVSLDGLAMDEIVRDVRAQARRSGLAVDGAQLRQLVERRRRGAA